MMVYRERLWPTAWMFAVSTLLLPAGFFVLAPIAPAAGIVCGITLYLLVVAVLLLASPVIAIDDSTLRAGKARIPLSMTGTAVAYRNAEAHRERGVRLDARAWLLLRGWVKHVVKVPITDPEDPVPYWLISTRNPDELAAAINNVAAQPQNAR